MATLDEINAALKTDIAKHWASCEKAGLPHDAASRDAVLAAFEAYISTLKHSGSRDRKQAILPAIETLYATLDTINEKHDGGLLETDERELLVPVIVSAAEAAGLNLGDFPDEEPGQEFRNF